MVAPPEKAPGADAVPMGEEKADEDVAALKTEDQNEYDLEEQVPEADKQPNNKPENVGIGTSAFPSSLHSVGIVLLLRKIFISFQLLSLLCSHL